MRRSLTCLAALALAAAAGCTSDPETPLGSGFIGGVIGSRPGETFQDTITIDSGDTTFVTNSVIAKSGTMTIGRENGFETAMLIRFDFSTAGSDTNRTVQSATLTLRVTDETQADSVNALFFELQDMYTESDTLSSLSLAAMPIPDSTGTAVDRVMAVFPLTHTLPPVLVQDWIRGSQPHNGIAIVLNDTTTSKELEYNTRQTDGTTPFLRVVFTDNTTTSYKFAADATFVKSLVSTTNRVLSDGVTRRVVLPIDLSGFDEELLLHNAKLVINLVSGSDVGEGDPTVELYAPPTSDIDNPAVLTGTFVDSDFLSPSTGRVTFAVRNIISRFVVDPDSNHGLVLRYAAEGTSARRIELHPSSASVGLRPFLTFTFSEAPDFPK